MHDMSPLKKHKLFIEKPNRIKLLSPQNNIVHPKFTCFSFALSRHIHFLLPTSLKNPPLPLQTRSYLKPVSRSSLSCSSSLPVSRSLLLHSHFLLPVAPPPGVGPLCGHRLRVSTALAFDPRSSPRRPSPGSNPGPKLLPGSPPPPSAGDTGVETAAGGTLVVWRAGVGP